VAVEVLIAEVTPTPGDGKRPAAAAPALDAKEFNGPSPEVIDKVEALKKKGLLGGLKRIQLTAVENQPASVRIGESRPVVTGITTRGAGPAMRSITYRNTGTIAGVTVRLAEAKVISLDVNIEDARLHTPADGIVLGTDEAGAPIRATEIITAALKTKLSVPSGQAVAAQGVQTETKSGPVQTLIIVAARVIESEAGGRSGDR
jgi:hypothetical protein